jgi:pimeloyl-ACP methyl ester carboxylesterase
MGWMAWREMASWAVGAPPTNHPRGRRQRASRQRGRQPILPIPCRLPLLYGQMACRPVPDELVRRWTEPVLRDPDVRRDLLAYARGPFDKAALVRDTEALRRFQGDALVLWSPDNRVMPAAHGRRLAALLPRARYAEIPGAYVLSTLDEPEAVAREMGEFLNSAPATRQPRQDRNRP